MMKNKIKILYHLIFWIAVWFFYVYFFSYNSSDRVYIFWFSGSLLPVTMAITYLQVNFLIPRFLLTKRYWQFALYSFYTLVGSAYLIVLVMYACLIFILKFNVANIPPMGKNFTFVLILVYLVVGIVCFVNILNNNFKTISKNKELQNKILNAQLQLKEQELHYLKRQIHPHFLFNTLNTIYGFALKQSKHTPEIILKLSNLLDYILYQVNKPLVGLREEAEHIREYIELERIRFQETLKVDFKSGDIEQDIQIAPMLLIPFVENAFKHGDMVEGFLQIQIQIEVIHDNLNFSIKNTMKDKDQDIAENGGLGLENIQKRLDLNYEGQYHLHHSIADNWYMVELKVENLNRSKDA